MRMFNQAVFICSHTGCGQSLPLEMINQHELYICKQRRIHSPADRCSFISRLDHVIIHSVQCPFHIIYCGRCKTSYNDSGWNHECKLFKPKQVYYSRQKVSFRHRQSPLTHLHGDVILNPHSFENSFESYNQTRFDKFKSQASNSTSPFILLAISPISGRPMLILQRQNGVIEDDLQYPIQTPHLQRNLQRPHDDEDSASNFNFN